MRNIFPEKSHTKCGEKIVPSHFLKNQKWACLGINSEVLYSSFLLNVQVQGYWTILKVSCRALAFTSCKAFLKTERSFEIVFCLSFCMIFEETYLSRIILLTDQTSLSDNLYFLRFEQYVCCNCLFPRL